MSKHGATVLIAMLILPTSLLAKEQILCSYTGKPDVVITLGAMKKFGHILNCISGKFIADMTPCAPSGGYGLSAGTGSAQLVAVVNRWQDYANHIGGIASNLTDDHSIHFSGGINFPASNKTVNQNRAGVGLPPIPGGDKVPEGQGYQELWSFTLSRLTGDAELKEKGKAVLTYKCRKADAIL